MEGLEHRIARDLFATAKKVGRRLLASEAGIVDVEIEGDSNSDVFEFNVTFLELLGKKAVDLIETPTTVDDQGNPIRKEVPVKEDKVGDIRPRLVSTEVKSSDDLESLINNALAHRRTSPTLRNAASSRSHALLTIRVKNRLLPYAEEGKLILVDLAGSERYEDSKMHSKQRMDESRENNKSLMVLKDCVRAKAKMAQEDGFVHIPWRSNVLTMLLKPIFDVESRQPSRTAIIAHVSPHIQDVVHSGNTLSYASPFKTAPPKPRGPAPYDKADPRTWNHEQTLEWLEEEFIKVTKAKRNHDREERVKGTKRSEKSQIPPEDDAVIILAVDLDKLCPVGMTAMQFGRLYTMEFVEQCLLAIPAVEGPTKDAPKQRGRLEADAVKYTAMKVIGRLFYLMLTAKTRTRNEIMKSRKKLVVDETYGDIPDGQPTFEQYNHIEMMDARTAIGNEMWVSTMDKFLKNAEEEGTSLEYAKKTATKSLMDRWRAQQANKAGGTVKSRVEVDST
ncbi:hypothetical protein SERLADRAFT_463324 [Serpula lacrymans var. lacrymans S7.9]|uniref:Kinesin-like protein n=1 Tax=Serpula lacrymans var. lacrymans (strain S7.9) TaxID=578457 RepID=F8NRY8_SERL9|nr:uncharacterized protein SERLADRAFT_463324 [Serpula lacrymans var. lacrymans S7.9]EGO26350.1 hypothetical protein SERLADRAFT_463324 [Serpula lacrymans var. lacrymans S7.9]